MLGRSVLWLASVPQSHDCDLWLFFPVSNRTAHLNERIPLMTITKQKHEIISGHIGAFIYTSIDLLLMAEFPVPIIVVMSRITCIDILKMHRQ